MKEIIGIYSPIPQSGKSTVYGIIAAQKGYARYPFAGPLKELIVQFLIKLGLTLEQAETLVYEEKEEQVPGLPEGRTPRYLMQKFGTDFARNQVDQEIWIKMWKASVESAPSDVTGIVVDDVRFPNELKAIREMGGKVWKVVRPQPPQPLISQIKTFLFRFFKWGYSVNGHASEGALENEVFDAVIINDGTIADLCSKVSEALEK